MKGFVRLCLALLLCAVTLPTAHAAESPHMPLMAELPTGVVALLFALLSSALAYLTARRSQSDAGRFDVEDGREKHSAASSDESTLPQ